MCKAKLLRRQSRLLSRAPRCCLTPHSSGAPPACHQARSSVRSIFLSPGLAASRRRPLSSNVGSKMQVVGASQQIQRLRRELGSHEAAAPQDANRAQMRTAPLSMARSKTSPESKNAFSTVTIPIFESRGHSRLKSGAGIAPAKAKPNAANRGETVGIRGLSRYRSAILKESLCINFVATRLVQGKSLVLPMQSVVLRST